MIISELFNWLHGKEESRPLSNPFLSLDLLESERTQAKIKNRKLLADIRLAKFSSQDASDLIDALEQHNLFMDYLKFCKQKFAEDAKNSLFLITFKYLLSKSQLETPYLGAKWNELFFALLQEDRDNTLSFYQDNEALFKNHPEIQKRVALELHEQKRNEEIKRIKNHLVHLSEQLSNQKNPLGIIGLCREWVSDTELFAALILWLLQRDVSTEKILQTYLLHDFLKYYLFTLYSEENEIFHLYALLNHFPETKLLVEAAKQIRSDEEAFQQYALDGTQSKSELQNIPQIVPPLQFSLKPSNFLALHKLFGKSFLLAAITSVEEKNLKWLHVLSRTLNSPPIIERELSAIINSVAREYSPQTLEYLAHLIDDETAQQLLSNNDGAVFYLLPYKPKLFDHVNEENVTRFIQHITIGYTADPEIIFQLMALFLMLSKQKNPLTQLVFEAILDNLALHPMLLEDEKLIRQLRKYPDCGKIIDQKSGAIKQQLNACIIAQASESTFTSHNYNLIEDTWLDATRKLTVFDLIKPQAKFNLNNKYALQAKTAEVAFLCHGDHFDLNAFIDALSLPPVIADEVSEYERILVEIFAVIDNESIRNQIIKQLESPPVQRLNWVEKEYEGKTIFTKAAQHANLGLITLLEDQIAPEAFNKAIRTAARANQWSAVDHLCRNNKAQLTQDELEKIIFRAAEHGQLKIIKYLLNTYDYEPSPTKLISILNAAITNNQLNVIQFFYNSSDNLPNQSGINKLFHAAIELGHWDIALLIAHSEQHAPSRTSIEKALNQAADAMQLDAMKALCHVPTNTPRAQVIQSLFVKACQVGNLPMVQCLHELPEKLPPAPLGEGLTQASVKGHMGVIRYLCNSSNPPNQPLINQGLIAAAKAGQRAPVEFFSSMTTKNKPTQNGVKDALHEAVKNNGLETFTALCRSQQNPPSSSAIREAFLLAVKVGNLNVIEYVGTNEMNSLNRRTVEEALKLAIKHKKPETTRYLCELPTNAPDKKSLRIAVNKAVATGQTAVADYLREQLKSKVSTQKNSDSEFDNSSGTDNDSELTNVLELDTHSEIDIEIASNPEVDNSAERDNRLAIDNSPETEGNIEQNQDTEVGIPLKNHGLFKTKAHRNIPSADLVGAIVLR
ncbi:Ankyrin repeats (3 copies) [Legionella steigerwaltii]|uniref:Ankyrin repeats (3 copies) n=1 Tax=Legionella steigerwaltii TaxID=460 RepID=A0A378L4I4_9GAMM|nr:ankyrin repeat domain-containing protein [Legionella steigerwaltii]KTD77417.1 Ankyrin repeats (3 copies) [Legionella steigerwaltii]STY21716.1 Ankyrin repeats (3 copies) [Legionella steigerwaltii]